MGSSPGNAKVGSAESDLAHTKPSEGPWLSEIHQVAAAAFAVGVIIASMYGPLGQRETGDPAIYDYIAQTILRGGLPYRDVLDVKGPGSSYLSALAMAAGRVAGTTM